MFLHISTGREDENEMRWLDVNDGFLLINATQELGLRPSRMSLEALLDGCAALNDSEQPQEMEREGLQLNFLSMIRCSFSSNSLLVSSNTFEEVVINTDFYHSLYPSLEFPNLIHVKDVS